jgi:hypothetical protein
MLSGDEVFLRIWTPSFTHLDIEVPVELTIRKVPRFSSAQIHRGDPQPMDASEPYEAVLFGKHGQGDSQPMDAAERHFTLNLPISFPDKCAYERVYALPADLVLEPQKEYRISGQIRDQKKNTQIFEFIFRTDSRGLPIAY